MRSSEIHNSFTQNNMYIYTKLVLYLYSAMTDSIKIR